MPITFSSPLITLFRRFITPPSPYNPLKTINYHLYHRSERGGTHEGPFSPLTLPAFVPFYIGGVSPKRVMKVMRNNFGMLLVILG